MTMRRHARHAAPHLCVWGALALSLLLLLVSCPVKGGGSPLPAGGGVFASVTPQSAPPGVFRVETLRKDAWVPVGETAHGQFLSEETLEIKGLVPGQPTRIRITARCPGAAQLDAVLLGGYAPIAARNALLRKLVAADGDLNNIHGRRVELTFAPGGETSARLSITGRIEPQTLDVRPFQFPLPNQGRVLSSSSAAYTYRLGAQRGRLTLNGELDEEHLPEKPLFAERVSPASGHPEGTVYGWARDDARTLYLALDVVPDNTYDADKDYAIAHVRVNDAWRDFKVDVSNRAWGRSGFTYTRKARHEHKVYEFALPLAQLGLEGAPKGTPVKLAFTVYGTAGLGK